MSTTTSTSYACAHARLAAFHDQAPLNDEHLLSSAVVRRVLAGRVLLRAEVLLRRPPPSLPGDVRVGPSPWDRLLLEATLPEGVTLLWPDVVTLKGPDLRRARVTSGQILEAVAAGRDLSGTLLRRLEQDARRCAGWSEVGDAMMALHRATTTERRASWGPFLDRLAGAVLAEGREAPHAA